MSRLSILYFTEGGKALAQRLSGTLNASLEKPASGELYPRVADLFQNSDALLFIGACGIAVRAIAPLVVSKTSDPAVVVMDEQGKYIIPLLSGHIGGANQLAHRLAAMTGGTAVITTATDVNGRFSVDAWAARHGLYMDSMKNAKAFSARILQKDLPLYSDFACSGALPSGLFWGKEGEVGVAVTCRTSVQPFSVSLRVVPRILHVGIGCKKGTPEASIHAAIQQALAQESLDPHAVCSLASIDVKKNEDGLLRCALALGLPLRFYTAQELEAVEGRFSASPYVKSIVGVDNVCERAACKSAGSGAMLLLSKTILNGVTVAVAQEKWSVSFDEAVCGGDWPGRA